MINASKSLHLDFDKHEILIEGLIDENKFLKNQISKLKEDNHKANSMIVESRKSSERSLQKSDPENEEKSLSSSTVKKNTSESFELETRITNTEVIERVNMGPNTVNKSFKSSSKKRIKKKSLHMIPEISGISNNKKTSYKQLLDTSMGYLFLKKKKKQRESKKNILN